MKYFDLCLMILIYNIFSVIKQINTLSRLSGLDRKPAPQQQLTNTATYDTFSSHGGQLVNFISLLASIHCLAQFRSVISHLNRNTDKQLKNCYNSNWKMLFFCFHWCDWCGR